MPTALRWQGHRFYFFSHEPNEPPHVHVDKGSPSAKFWLQPVALARNVGLAPHELARLQRKISRARQFLMDAWHGYFGAKR